MFLPVVDLPVRGPHLEPVAVLYPPFSVNWNEILDRTISELTNNRLPPSRILFVCPKGTDVALVKEFRRQQERLRDRLRATSQVIVAAYDDRGQVTANNVVNLWQEGRQSWTVTDDVIRTAATKYIADLCSRTNALLTAPAGYQFQKPSGASSSIFLRAGNMLREIDSMNVYSNMLLRKWPAGAQYIYVDSFTILSFAMALQNIVKFFTDKDAQIPTIENFHSYDKAKGLSFPANDDDYIIVISASTSGELARKLVNEHGASEKRIVHLIGAGDGNHQSTFANSCIYYYTRRSAADRVALDNIRIDGEEFLPSYGQPERVPLTTSHIKTDDARRYKGDFYIEHLKVQPNAGRAGYESYALFSVSNTIGDIGPKGLEDWMKNQLIHEIPASTSLVVHLDDPISKKLAEDIAQKIPNRSVEVIVDEDVATHEGKLSRENSILIVASEDPSLEGFVRVSTELRRWPEAYRHFVLAHAFPETRGDFDKVAQSLRMRSGDLLRYGWSTFSVAPVGRLDQHAKWLFDYPVDFCGAFGEPTSLKPPLSDALREYATGRHIFLPKLDGSWLRLRGGSVFFEGQYGDLSDAVVYLAVTTAVQRVREGGGTGSRTPRFNPNPFVGSVLDPQMFSRYSDGILQAALLRCLYPSELDYSQSTVLSRYMRELVVAVLRNAANVVGEAALEFMAALAVGKVSLREDDRQIVQDGIECNAELELVWKAFTARPPI